MPYDEALIERIRDLLADRADLTERKMFGGLAFLLGGHMAVAASGKSGLLARVDPDDVEELLATTGAVPMEMNGRSMTGWLHVPDEALRTDNTLRGWVARGVDIATSLPPKS